MPVQFLLFDHFRFEKLNPVNQALCREKYLVPTFDTNTLILFRAMK